MRTPRGRRMNKCRPGKLQPAHVSEPTRASLLAVPLDIPEVGQ